MSTLCRAILCSALALLGCDGCSGDAHPGPRAPQPAAPIDAAGTVATGDGGAAPMTGDGGVAPEPPIGSLDAPAGALDALYAALAATERADPAHPDPASRTLLLFFGDSHTAGDSMTSRLRVTLQQRFGDAGRGLVAAGRAPTRHYYQRDVHYGATSGWRAAVGGARGDSEPFGIAGLRVFGTQKGAQLWVETCSDCLAGKSVGQFEILYYAAPDHGVLRYRVDDQPWAQISTKTTAAEPPHPAREVVPVADGAHKLTLEHGGGGVLDLFGVVMERTRPGVIVDSLGVVGRRLGSLRSWDWSIIGEQLATRDPKLVVLQYGTNEADDPDLSLDDLARYYDETILRIRAAAPTSSILILGPPDMGTREGGKACDHMKKSAAGAGSGSAAVIPECQWRTPAVLGNIIAVEHAAAIRNKVAFFDTFAAMGGADQMDTWFNAEPRVAYKDRVHFTDIGYQTWADALSSALLRGYARWREDQHLPASSKAAGGPPPRTPQGSAELPGSSPATAP
jgi:lysophospholipase L1-like esterase